MVWRMYRLFLAIGSMGWYVVNPAFAQSALKRFQAQQVHRDILLTWILETGKVCNGIRILRSDDPGAGFEEIFYIGGVCGSIQDTVAYDYYDTQTPEKSLVYYLLDLNELGLSDTLRAEWFAHGTGEVILFFDVVARSIRLVTASGEGEK